MEKTKTKNKKEEKKSHLASGYYSDIRWLRRSRSLHRCNLLTDCSAFCLHCSYLHDKNNAFIEGNVNTRTNNAQESLLCPSLNIVDVNDTARHSMIFNRLFLFLLFNHTKGNQARNTTYQTLEHIEQEEKMICKRERKKREEKKTCICRTDEKKKKKRTSASEKRESEIRIYHT